MQKRIFLIHGWGGSPFEGWRPWLKKELEKKGYLVIVPSMPNPMFPKLEEWVGHLDKVVGELDENCYFVGHSLGCITILKYFELISFKKAGGAILVAGFATSLGIPVIENFTKKELDFEKVKKSCKKFIAIHSDNDLFVGLYHADHFEEKLGAKIIIKEKHGHFSSADGFVELPVVLEEIEKLIGG